MLAQKDPGAAAVEGPRRGRRLRVHGPLHQARRRRQAHRRGRQARRHHGAGQGAGRDVRHGRQPRDLRPGEASDHLQRVVHDQLPRADRQGAARDVRHQEGLDDDGPRLHERSAAARPAAQGPAPRARGGALDDSDDDGRGRAVGEVLPALKGKLDGISVRVPTPNVSVVDLSTLVGRKTTAEEVNAAFKAAADGRLQGHHRVRDRAARVDRLPRQPALGDARRAVHEGDRRQLRQDRSRGTTTSGATRAGASICSATWPQGASKPRARFEWTIEGTIRDLDARRPARVRARGLQRADRAAAGSPTTRASARRCRRSRTRSITARR